MSSLRLPAQTAMSYHVGVDKDEQTSERYMEAVGATGIPHAFVIDQEGKPLSQETKRMLAAKLAEKLDDRTGGASPPRS